MPCSIRGSAMAALDAALDAAVAPRRRRRLSNIFCAAAACIALVVLPITAYLGQSLLNLSMTIGFLSIPPFARVARAATLTLAQREFVTAARALGATHARILLRELLPNVSLPLLAFFLLAVAVTIVVEGALSLLGLGVPPPTGSWGSISREGRESLDIPPWASFLPAGVHLA